jgi:hypothetical protein
MVAAEYETREYSDLERVRDFSKPFGVQSIENQIKDLD